MLLSLFREYFYALKSMPHSNLSACTPQMYSWPAFIILALSLRPLNIRWVSLLMKFETESERQDSYSYRIHTLHPPCMKIDVVAGPIERLIVNISQTCHVKVEGAQWESFRCLSDAVYSLVCPWHCWFRSCSWVAQSLSPRALSRETYTATRHFMLGWPS